MRGGLGRESMQTKTSCSLSISAASLVRPARAQLVGDMSPDLMRGGIGLQEDLADRGGDHRVLALGRLRQGAPDPMHPHLCQVTSSDTVAQVANRRSPALDAPIYSAGSMITQLPS